jgi:hypothetical protein
LIASQAMTVARVDDQLISLAQTLQLLCKG